MAADELELRPYQSEGEDRLPWLETVEPDEEEGPGVWRVVVAVLVGLGLVAAAAFAWFQLKRPATSTDGGGALIAAQEGDYKVKPDDPGGLKVDGEGDAAVATSAGKAGDAAIDLRAVPETPITGKRAAAPAGADAGASRASAAVPAPGGRLAATPPMAPPRASVPGAASGQRCVERGRQAVRLCRRARQAGDPRRGGRTHRLPPARQRGQCRRGGGPVRAAEGRGRGVFRHVLILPVPGRIG